MDTEIAAKYQSSKEYARKIEASRLRALAALNAALAAGDTVEVKKQIKGYNFAVQSAFVACQNLHEAFLAHATEQAALKKTPCPACGAMRVPIGIGLRQNCPACQAKRNEKQSARMKKPKAAGTVEAIVTAPALVVTAPAPSDFNWQDASLIRCLRAAKESKSIVDRGYFFIVTLRGQKDYACVMNTIPQHTVVLEVTARVAAGKTRAEWFALHTESGVTKNAGMV